MRTYTTEGQADTSNFRIRSWWQIPYFYAGCKMYDILAGKQNMESSYVLGKGKALEAFPMLKSDGLRGAVVYYDGGWRTSFPTTS